VVILGEVLVMNCPQGCHTLKALGIAYHLVIKYVVVIAFLCSYVAFSEVVLCISASHIVCLLFFKRKK
jgi:hypothetical protein